MPAKVRSYRKTNPNFVSVFKHSAMTATARQMHSVADEFRDTLQEVIRSQLMAWKPLSPGYQKAKKKSGLDERILIATGEYVSKICVMREETKNGVLYSVGFPSGALHEGSGLPLHVLARVHEFGSSKAHVPPRPHWRPTISMFMSRVPRMTKDIQEDIIRALHKSYKRRFRNR